MVRRRSATLARVSRCDAAIQTRGRSGVVAIGANLPCSHDITRKRRTGPRCCTRRMPMQKPGAVLKVSKRQWGEHFRYAGRLAGRALVAVPTAREVARDWIAEMMRSASAVCWLTACAS